MVGDSPGEVALGLETQELTLVPTLPLGNLGKAPQPPDPVSSPTGCEQGRNAHPQPRRANEMTRVGEVCE